MPRSNTWRTVGWEADIGEFSQISPTIVQITGVTPVKWPSSSTGIDLSAKGRHSFLVLIQGIRAAHSETITITESATTNGTYNAATTSGTLTTMTATGTQYATVKYNPAKPFIRVTATGADASSDWVMSASLLAY